jgi:putative SOS response-associated peptidase YedK
LGRYSLTKRRKEVDKEVAARLGVRLDGGDEAYARFNIAPTQDVPALVQDRHGRRAELLRWGLVPRWARALNTGLSMINARAETLATSRAYGGLVERGWHRCLIVADGFYEWIAAEDPKQPRLPLRYSLADGASFCFAGLWTTWRAPDGGGVRSCSVVTTTANELVAPVHDRMPVVFVDESGWEPWLDPGLDADAVATLLAPLPPEALRMARANPALNSPDHEGPDCLVAPAG